MTPGRGGRAVTVRAPGKINPGLAVGGRRPDGYHELATLLVSVSRYDEVTVGAADRLRVTVSGPAAGLVPADGSNLAARAAQLVARHAGVEPAVHVHILKRLPVLGGMGGGSADAAAALVACDAFWGLGLDRAELGRLAAQLGSDVPFCLQGGAALAYGRGERIQPVEAAAPFHWVLADADGGLSTPGVFAAWDRACARDQITPPAVPQLPAQLIKAVQAGDPRVLAQTLVNDLEPVALEMLPALARTRAAGLAAGALASLLSGTGATYAFLAASEDDARVVAARLAASGTCAAAHVAQGPVSRHMTVS